MAKYSVPHLCGGILFGLILEARKSRSKARNKLEGGSDHLTAQDVFCGLIYTVTGDDMPATAGKSMAKCASNYKKCVDSTGVYVPFTDSTTQSAFDSAVKRSDPKLLQRVSEFITAYLNGEKFEWLVRALIETMQKDKAVNNDTSISIAYDKKVNVEDLNSVTTVIAQPFFISVLHYVIMNCPDAESGRSTFEAWFSQSRSNAEWKFHSDIGSGIQPLTIN